MSLASLQHVEKLFGNMVCAVLHGPAKLIPKPQNMNPDHVKKVLIVKFFGIGSLVLATPFFRAAKNRFPNAEIHLLTLSSNRAVMDMIDEIDQSHYVDLGGNVGAAIVAFMKTMWRAFKGRYDVLIDMEFYTRASAIVALASWAPVRIGYHAPGIYRGGLHSHRIPFNSYWHVKRNFLSLLEPYGYLHTSHYESPKLAIPDGLTDQARAVLEEVGRHYVVINVNAGELAYERRWYPERFAELVSLLGKKFDVPCVFIGAPAERDYVQSVIDDVQSSTAKVVNTAGQLDLISMTQVCRDSQLVISNDSGPLHIAAASGAPVVGFFGPETPVLYGPVGDGHMVFHEPLSCSPCINIEQGKRLKCWHDTAICQEATTADDAFKAISKVFGSVLKSS